MITTCNLNSGWWLVDVKYRVTSNNLFADIILNLI